MTALAYIAIALGLLAAGEGVYIGASHRNTGADVVVDVEVDADALVAATGAAANAERLAELRVSAALAEAPAVSVVCRAAVEPDADARTVALCATLACWSHVEGAETSAGLGCQDRGEVLDGLLQVEDAP